MSYNDGMSREERLLESLADELIGKYDRNEEYPARSEESLECSGRNALNMEGVVENAHAIAQADREELLFLIPVTTLEDDVRLCMQLWTDNWTQREIASVMGICQQRVSQLLDKGKHACYENRSVCFREVSRHTRPRHRRSERAIRYCISCGEPY